MFDLTLHLVCKGADVFICQVVAVDSALCWHRGITCPGNHVSVKQSSSVSSGSSYKPSQMSADIIHLWPESEQGRMSWPHSSSAEPPALGIAPGPAPRLPFTASSGWPSGANRKHGLSVPSNSSPQLFLLKERKKPLHNVAESHSERDGWKSLAVRSSAWAKPSNLNVLLVLMEQQKGILFQRKEYCAI